MAGTSESALGTPRSTSGAAELSEAGEMARLDALPPSHIPLRGATLSSAIRLLAEASQLSYLAPPDAEFTERVTSNVTMNPFRLLQVLAESYRFGMDYDHGLWRFYRINLNEMVTKSYTLRFDNLESVSISSSNLSSQLSASSSSSSSTMSSAGGSSGAAGSAPTTSFSNTVFTHDSKTSKIIDNVRKILTVPTVSTATRELDDSPLNPGVSASLAPQAAPPVDPIWNPDTSQLFVVATRQQHSLVAAYLKTIDRPQKLIKISVKFVETERDPSQTFGIDWSQTFLGSGGPVTLSGAPNVAAGQSLAQAVSSGTLPLATAFNLANPSSTLLPASTLSAPAMQLTMQAIASDKRSSIVQDPVIFTSNNREVTFKSTTETPIQQGSTTFGSATAATSASITYIEIGTQLSVMPNLLPGDGEGKETVLLNLSINVSAIIGSQTIGGNSYPVTSNRTYSYSVPIENGKTLAIAGLEERSRSVSDSKVPLLGDIPVLGYLFKNRNDSATHTTLIAFITPDVIPAERSEADEVLPSFQHRVFQGSEAESLREVEASLADLPADIAALRRAATARNREAVLNRLDRIGVELSLIDVRLGELKLSDHITGLKSAAVEKCRQLLDQARHETAKLGHANEST